MRLISLGLTLALVLAAVPVFAQAAPTTIYVFTATDPSGLTDDATRDRLAAVAGIRERLAKNTAVTVVGTPAAQIAVEVTRYDRAILRSGTFQTTLDGRITDAKGSGPATFKRLFKNHPGEQIATAIEAWLQKNVAALTTMGSK